LYKDLLPFLNTEEHSLSELMNLKGRYQYIASTAISLLGNPGEEKPYVSFSWISLDENLQMGYDLMKEQFFHAVLSQEEVAQGLSSLLSSIRSSIQSTPFQYLLQTAGGRVSRAYRYMDNLKGVPFYEFLLKVDEKFKENPQELIDHLTELRESIYNRNGAIALYAGNEESIRMHREISDAWLLDLGNEEREPSGADYPIPPKNVALIVDSNVQYNGILADYAVLGVEDYEYEQRLISSIMDDRFLLPILRDTYGVYDILQQPIQDVGYTIISYRDPNVGITYDVYAQLSEKLANLEITQEEVDQYIMNTYSSLALPNGELSGAVNAATLPLLGKDQNDVFTYMRQLKSMTPEKIQAYVPFFEKLSAEGGKFTAGGAAAINENADLFDEILNPFGVEDLSDKELADVAMDDADADIIKSVVTAGFLSLDENGSFRPEEEATAGDVAAFIYSLLGGGSNQEEAVAALSQYGLLSPETAVEDVPTREEIANLLASLMTLSGVELTPGEEEVSIADEASPAMNWALTNGIMLPKEKDGELVSASEDPLLRKELAKLIYVFAMDEDEAEEGEE
ncbi:MAG: S-layer homology domain-containing protein, partial [Blautia sp.]|nr:S-layer homology domain-containing protein [Blautia sp.]